MAGAATGAPRRERRHRGRALPPGPSEPPIVGQSLRYVRDTLGLMREGAAHGDIATLSVRPSLVYQITHPDLIHELFVRRHRVTGRGQEIETLRYLMGNSLVTSDGEEHRRQRRMLQPQFHRSRIAGFAASMAASARRRAEGWSDGARLDVNEEMTALTLEIVVKTLFGIDLPPDVREAGEAIEVANRYVTARSHQPRTLRRLAHRLPTPRTLRFRRALASLDRMAYGLIEARRADAGGDRSDLLSMLLDAQDPDTGEGIGDDEVRDQTVTFFASGHETTGAALTWTWYLLAAHPEAERRFHAELDAVLGDRLPAIGDLPNLPYLERVVTESMRLYPPIWTLSRWAFEPFELGGYEVPAGALILCPQLLVHRDARWYEEPLAFRPERWTPRFRAALPRFAYYPFGGGARICIGDQFALTEAKLVLAAVGQRWRLRYGGEGEPGLAPLVSLRPRGGMPMTAERRR